MLQLPDEFPTRRSPRGFWLQVEHWQGFEWNHLDLPISDLPRALQGLRIVHLSDTHVKRRWLGAYDKLIHRLGESPPDLILFTGDFVDHVVDHRPALRVLERLLTQLKSRLGIFGVVGNHDGDLLGPVLPRMGVRVIERQCVALESDGAAIELIGLPGSRRRDFDPNFVDSVPPRRPGVPRFILCHYPDLVQMVAPLEADAMFCGHTHGGQVCLPGGRALISHDMLPKHKARGVHDFGQTRLIVNRGFGMTRWPIRIFCPPEVIEIRLTT